MAIASWRVKTGWSIASEGAIFAALAAITWSTAGILQLQLHVDLVTQVAGRSFFGFAALALLAGWEWHREPPAAGVASWFQPAALGVTVLAAISSATFIVALDQTAVANVLFFLGTGPIIAALLGARFLGERLAAKTVAATALAFAGVVVMIGSPSGGALLGDCLAFAATLTFAGIIVLCRRHPEISMVPALCLAQLIIFLATAPFADPSQLNLDQLGWLFLLGAGQLALGQAFFVRAARLIAVAEVATISLLELVLGPLWVWIGGYQSPTAATIVGGSLVLLAVLFQILATPSPSTAPGP